MALGIVALLIGLGAASIGAYVGFGTTGLLVTMPAGLPPVSPETAAMVMFVCGAVTMMLGAMSIYRSAE